MEFYLLEDYAVNEPGMAIIEDYATIGDTALIHYDEILSYNPGTHTFKVQDEAIDRLEFASAFAVTVDREIIYTGYFWSGLSSMSVDWVVIDLIFTMNNVLKVELGYPGGHPTDHGITDKRNDPRILDVFSRDHKLIEQD